MERDSRGWPQHSQVWGSGRGSDVLTRGDAWSSLEVMWLEWKACLKPRVFLSCSSLPWIALFESLVQIGLEKLHLLGQCLWDSHRKKSTCQKSKPQASAKNRKCVILWNPKDGGNPNHKNNINLVQNHLNTCTLAEANMKLLFRDNYTIWSILDSHRAVGTLLIWTHSWKITKLVCKQTIRKKRH